MQSPSVTNNARPNQEHTLEDLLDESAFGGGIVQGAEESFDFDPPQAMTSHQAATGFDAEFTDSVVID